MLDYAEKPRRQKVHRWQHHAGVSAVEYAIMLVLIALAAALFGSGLSGSVTSVFSRLVGVLSP